MDENKLCFCPSATHEPSFNIGACNGERDLAAGLKEAVRAGSRAAAVGFTQPASQSPNVNSIKQNWRPLAHGEIPNGHLRGRGPKPLSIFRMTLPRVMYARHARLSISWYLKHIYHNWHGNRSRKTSNINALAMLADALGDEAPKSALLLRMPTRHRILEQLLTVILAHCLTPFV